MLKMYNYKNKVINGVMLVTILFNLMLALVGSLSKVVAETNNTTSLGDFGDSAGNTQADFYSGNTTKGVGKETHQHQPPESPPLYAKADE